MRVVRGFSLSRLFSWRLVGIIGSIGSIAGVVVSVYFYSVSKESPNLTYFVHPARAIVLRTNQTSNLTVQFDGQDLASNVTTAQIAFWNAGNKPIRQADILKPLVIRTGDGSRILEVRLRKSSRDVVQIALNVSRLMDAVVEIGWNILEQNDGGVIQIVYAGDETVDIQATAVVTGQREIATRAYGHELRSIAEEYTYRQRAYYRLPIYIIIILSAGLLTSASLSFFMKNEIGDLLFRSKKDSEVYFYRITKVIYIIPIIMASLTAALGIFLLLWVPPSEPPFGF